MKPTQSILILLSLFLISNCGDKVREEITDRYENGNKKLLVKYKGEGVDEILVERITYSKSGDTLIWENYNSKGVRDGNWIGYVDDSFVKGNYKDGEKNGEWTSYHENGQMMLEGNTKDGKSMGKWTYYNEDGSIKKVEEYKNGKLIRGDQ